MASLQDSYAMSNDTEFINRVSSAVATTAYNIITTEADTEPDHDQRYAFARDVVKDVNAYAYQFTRMVVANPTIAEKAPNQADVPDGDILYVVNTVWTDFAPPLSVAPPAEQAGTEPTPAP